MVSVRQLVLRKNGHIFQYDTQKCDFTQKLVKNHLIINESLNSSPKDENSFSHYLLTPHADGKSGQVC